MSLVIRSTDLGSYSLFAGTNDGIFLSTNNGANWNVINSGLTNTYVPALAVSGTNVFAGTYEDCGAFLSTDNGVSWSAVNTGLTNSSHFRRSFIKGTNINVLAIKNTNLFAGTNNGVFLSTNNGTNWSAINSGLTNTCISALAASPSEVAGTNLFAGTEDDGIFISTNSGSSWSAVNTGLTSPIAALAASSNEVGGTNLFVGTYSGVFLSTNNGARWHPVVNTALTYVSAFVVSPNGVGGTNLFAGAGGGVFLSTDIGTSWTIVNTGLRHINVFVVSRYGPGGTNLFAGTSSGGVFLSTDNGANWTAANTGLTDPDVRALTVSSNGARGTNLFAGTWGGGVFLSTDNGASWSAVNSGLPKWPYDTTLITSVNTFEVIGANLFAGTDEGIFLSTDNGTHWSEVNSGLRNHIVRVLAISPATGGRDSTNLFAGTFGSGVWRRPLSEMITTSVRQSSAQAPERFELEQNYPNPFNPSTVISYQLAVNSNVTLKVYDLLGREVAVLVNERKDAGRYSVQWSASRFSSGIYFYFLSAGKFQETKRMILLK